MLINQHRPTSIWLWGYVLINLCATIWMLAYGELLGDAAGVPISNVSDLLIAFFLVIASYVFLLGPLFGFFSNMKIKKIFISQKMSSIMLSEYKLNLNIGWIILVIQLSFMVFNLANHVNIAGSAHITADSIFSIVWVLLPVDSLFLIYYGIVRENSLNRLVGANLLVYLISNFLRGWTGMLLFIMFLEWCRAVRHKKIRFKPLVIISFIIIFLYPFVLSFKWAFRVSGFSDELASEGITDALLLFSESDYISIIFDTIGQIVSRLQITSIVEEVIRYSTVLQNQFDLNVFRPFWMEGLHGIVYDRMFLSKKSIDVGVAFTMMEHFGNAFEIGSWNVNIGWVGWLFISPYWIPVFIIYTTLLCFLSVFFAKKIGMNPLFSDLIWLSWLVYLIPGWLGAFVGFIYALLVFLIFKTVLFMLPSNYVFVKNIN